MNILDKTKSDLLDIKLDSKLTFNSFDPIFSYFKNSTDFVLKNSGDGNQIQTTESDVMHYLNGEEDDKNTFEEYISFDKSFIIKIVIWDLRLIAIAIEKGFTFNGYSLEENAYSPESILVYKIVAANYIEKG